MTDERAVIDGAQIGGDLTYERPTGGGQAVAVWRDRARSVRTQVTVGATLVLAVALVVAAATTLGLLRRGVADLVESQLEGRVSEVQSLIDDGLLTAVLEPTGREVGQVQVVDVNHDIVARTPGLAGGTRLDIVDPPPVGEDTAVTVDGELIDGRPDERYRMVARTVDTPDGPLSIYAVSSLDASFQAQRRLRDLLLVGVPLLVAIAAFITYRVVGRALAPVEAMRAEVDRIQASNLSGRVEAPSRDDEIARLGETLNRMLGRLEESAARQQLFAAAASHELRSPLSAIRTELEVGLAYPDRAEWPRIAEDSLVEVHRLEELSRDLRLLTGGRSLSATDTTDFDLARLVEDEVGRRPPIRQLRYHCQLDPAMVQADRDGVTRVIRNLLDNAERHAVDLIEVRTGAANGTGDGDGDGRAWLTVANDGDPVPRSEHERIFDPFWRLDEARTLDAGGSGLGLAIARSIMAAHGGSISIVEGSGTASGSGRGSGSGSAVDGATVDDGLRVMFRAEFPSRDRPDPIDR